MAVSVFTCRFSSVLVEQLRPWWPLRPQGLEIGGSVGLFLVLMMLVGWLVRRMAGWVADERAHWISHSAGMIVGVVRGTWWAGMMVLFMLSFQQAYLTQSITERSSLAPSLSRVARTSLQWATDRLPVSAAQPAKPLLLR